MRFAEIVYDNRDRGLLHNRYRSLFSPFEYDMTEVLGAEGYTLRLNISKNADETSRQRVLKKAAQFLSENGVVAVTGESIEGLYRAEGKLIMSLLAAERVKGAGDVLVTGGERELTETVLCAVCPVSCRISLLTEQKLIYLQTEKYFFEEYGINIQMIDSFRHENVKNADIIINCSDDVAGFEYMLKKDCVFYDISGIGRRLDRMRRTRPDIRIINSAVIRQNGKSIGAETAECALYAVNNDFRRLVQGGLTCRERAALTQRITKSL